mgnify:CR=1 FL=1
MTTITCQKCFSRHALKGLKKICSNCFACTGCEVYRCPVCNRGIVVTLRHPQFDNSSG